MPRRHASLSFEPRRFRVVSQAKALKTIYGAPTAEATLATLEAFEGSALGQRFPTVTAAWRQAWT